MLWGIAPKNDAPPGVGAECRTNDLVVGRVQPRRRKLPCCKSNPGKFGDVLQEEAISSVLKPIEENLVPMSAELNSRRQWPRIAVVAPRTMHFGIIQTLRESCCAAALRIMRSLRPSQPTSSTYSHDRTLQTNVSILNPSSISRCGQISDSRSYGYADVLSPIPRLVFTSQ
jgi:hypothetical protein